MSTSLFYAYAKTISDDWTARYLIVFATRAVADEWWRAVSTSTNTAYTQSVQRVTPQFYTHNPAIANIAYSLDDATVASNFLGKVIFTLLPDRDGRAFAVIPPGPEITDNISNGWYYIRAKGDKSVYWYLNANNVIVASSTNSTRFNIRATDHTLDGKVMINSDPVTISLTSELSVSVATAGNLQAAGTPYTPLFGDFTDGYIINGNGSIHNATVPANAIMKVNDNSGEQWELTTNGRVSV